MNYPWSGRIGRVAKCCVYCGDSGPHFQLSSHGLRCLGKNCPGRTGGQPIQSLMDEIDREAERLARAWCKKNGYDYDEEIKKGPTL